MPIQNAGTVNFVSMKLMNANPLENVRYQLLSKQKDFNPEFLDSSADKIC
jgi:hypothetical protein